MKRDDLIREISKFLPDTQFFILGQGLMEGFPQREIKFVTFDEHYCVDEDFEEYVGSRYQVSRDDIILNET